MIFGYWSQWSLVGARARLRVPAAAARAASVAGMSVRAAKAKLDQSCLSRSTGSCPRRAACRLSGPGPGSGGSGCQWSRLPTRMAVRPPVTVPSLGHARRTLRPGMPVSGPSGNRSVPGPMYAGGTVPPPAARPSPGQALAAAAAPTGSVRRLRPAQRRLRPAQPRPGPGGGSDWHPGLPDRACRGPRSHGASLALGAFTSYGNTAGPGGRGSS